jgi:uncharacterized protein
MLFRRRNPLGLIQRAQHALWPASGWKRSSSYIAKRVLRLSASPHAIAAGFAAGVFASFTPFLFFHFLISIFVAFLIGGNILAALLGTAIGNPLTFPAIYYSTYKLGNFMLGLENSAIAPTDILATLLKQPLDSMIPLLQPLVVGGLPLGIIFGCLAYLIVFFGVSRYQRSRRLRFEARRQPTDRQDTNAQTPGTI